MTAAPALTAALAVALAAALTPALAAAKALAATLKEIINSIHIKNFLLPKRSFCEQK